ncbi:prospero homeobox protein 2-like [Vanacampus margaritifer]
MRSADANDGAGPDERTYAQQLLPFQQHPAPAKTQDTFLENGSETARMPLAGLYYSGGGEARPSPAAERSGRQAKRARVENIVRGMSGWPGGGTEQDPVQRPQGSQKPNLLEALPEERQPMWDATPRLADSYREDENITSGGHPRSKKTKLDNFSLKPEKVMADVLKDEISRAVSNSVDSIFKRIPLIQRETAESFLNARGKSLGCNEVKMIDVQTEALSLVVRNPQAEGLDRLGPTRQTTRQDSTDWSPNAVRRHTNGGSSEFEPGRAKFSSQVESRCLGSPLTRGTAMGPTTLLETVCFPRVKIPSSGLLKSPLYFLNEGLTTNHLKKAKLMFFYTRYPSSLVLKTCFRDVQFTRCIASQLIKWFSNFREFYYIQTERCARHAVAEGPAHAGALSVGRESQLFRALNVHYNKGGDFQVPDCFLRVAEITLREFYTAISSGKDRDPSWKKAIYKVICKMDADVPAQFKTCG